MGWFDDLLGGTTRSAVAGGIGAPVDAAALGLNALIAGGGYAGHKLGLLSEPPRMIENPVGGSEWIAGKMRGMGLLNDNPGSTADNWGNALGSVLGPLTAAKAPQIARGLLQMEANAAIPQKLNRQTGAIVWHGSPHKFDKFDSSKIGTGEGAQAYGHGLYLAESPDVARGYKNALSPGAGIGDDDTIVRALKMHGGDPIAAAKDLEQRAQYANIPGGKEKLLSLSEKLKAGYDPSGSLYKVDLPDEHIAKMLDWDKPLSQQPEAFKAAVSAREQKRMLPILEQRKAALAGLPPDAPNAAILKKQIAILEDEIKQAQPVPSMTGGEYFNYLRRREMQPAEQAEWLRQAGIPGIRYLDGGSRGAGSGTSNYVVFPGNEGLLKILERNGQIIP